VANDIVKNHLLHIGVFAMDGFIFHLHPDRQSATADVIASAGGNVLAHKFKFRIRLATQQRPTCIPVHLTDTQAPALDSVSPAMDSCRHNVLGGERVGASVKQSDAPLPAINVSIPPLSYLDAARLRPKPTNLIAALTSDGDKGAYSSFFAYGGEYGRRHLISTNDLRQTRTPSSSNNATPRTAALTHAKSKILGNFQTQKGGKMRKVCFRCLSTDHLVSQCRDPIKCTSCLRIGHKSNRCKRTPVPPLSSATLSAMAAASHMRTPASPVVPPPSPLEGSPARLRRSMAEAHVGNGDFEDARAFAYVYLRDAVHAPHMFIRRAMEQACGAPAFQLAASPRGAGIMVQLARREGRDRRHEPCGL
jgi:hypothetical protein